MYPVDLQLHRLIIEERTDALRRAALVTGSSPGSGRIRRRLGRWLVSAGVRLEFGGTAPLQHPPKRGGLDPGTEHARFT